MVMLSSTTFHLHILTIDSFKRGTVVYGNKSDDVDKQPALLLANIKWNSWGNK